MEVLPDKTISHWRPTSFLVIKLMIGEDTAPTIYRVQVDECARLRHWWYALRTASCRFLSSDAICLHRAKRSIADLMSQPNNPMEPKPQVVWPEWLHKCRTERAKVGEADYAVPSKVFDGTVYPASAFNHSHASTPPRWSEAARPEPLFVLQRTAPARSPSLM